MFGLQGYVTELLFTVTALLVDRFLSNLGLHRNKFLLFASNAKTNYFSKELLITCIKIKLMFMNEMQ
jgi:hypothetical protein